MEQLLVDLKSARTDKLNTEEVYGKFFILAVHLKRLGSRSWYLGKESSKATERRRGPGRGGEIPLPGIDRWRIRMLGSEVSTTKDRAPEDSLTGNSQILVFRI